MLALTAKAAAASSIACAVAAGSPRWKVCAGLLSGQAAARFEAERQALAALDHPGIAAVLGSGETEDGRPFLLMEWVEGETLSAFCRRQRPVSTPGSACSPGSARRSNTRTAAA
ncbi:MAG: hypothetical protein R3F11_27880 [Verrucomicrobiales bacterium]